MKAHNISSWIGKQESSVLFNEKHRYGTVEVQASAKDEIYNQILNHTKEFVNWVPPMNIIHSTRFMKIELTIPGITKDDCRIGCTGSLLWMRIHKSGVDNRDGGTFYRTFILPEEMKPDKIKAFYAEQGILIITIPREDEWM